MGRLCDRDPTTLSPSTLRGEVSASFKFLVTAVFMVKSQTFNDSSLHVVGSAFLLNRSLPCQTVQHTKSSPFTLVIEHNGFEQCRPIEKCAFRNFTSGPRGLNCASVEEHGNNLVGMAVGTTLIYKRMFLK